MKGKKYPNNPEGWKEELKDLKATTLHAKTALQNMRHFYPRLQHAANGQIDETALTIVRTLSLNRKPELIPVEGEYSTQTEMERLLWAKVRSDDPLLEKDKARILKAVQEFDMIFLKSLIQAMELCERGAIDHPDLVALFISYQTFETANGRYPSNRELSDVLGQLYPGITMDRKTVDYHCDKQNLPLAKAKKGRPLKKGK